MPRKTRAKKNLCPRKWDATLDRIRAKGESEAKRYYATFFEVKLKEPRKRNRPVRNLIT